MLIHTYQHKHKVGDSQASRDLGVVVKGEIIYKSSKAVAGRAAPGLQVG